MEERILTIKISNKIGKQLDQILKDDEISFNDWIENIVYNWNS